ncbi:MAG: hypothetical protein BMS9Abin36_1083 [Gammaproteobacteria bacterium]|nr:MAG: hypothetical protein BMS9Abin36_1083 [Gammaproteobacteria bacterium]
MVNNEFSTDKSNVLVVDDSRVVRKTILKMIGGTYNIIEAGDGEAGWRQLKQNSLVDLLITDIQMPQLDGYSLICRVRADEDEDLRNMPIVVITSTDDDITRERAYACGADDFILKPMKKDQLFDCIADKVAAQHSKTVAAEEEEEELKSSIGKLPAMDAALNTLRGPRAASMQPFAIDLALRAMPLLDYCNKNFGMNLDKEILSLKRKLLIARQARLLKTG